MSQNQYFRVGAGSVIYNEHGEILLFARTDITALWQLPQGGMDPGESSEENLWRELFEETAINKTDIDQVDLYPDWLLYEYPPEIRPRVRDGNCLGQIHKWYFLKLKSGTEIDVSKAVDNEFNQVKWSTFGELMKQTDHFKYQVYVKLSEYFDANIKPKP